MSALAECSVSLGSSKEARAESASVLCDSVEPHLPGAVLTDSYRLQIPSRPEWIVPTVEYLCERAMQCGACPQIRLSGLTVALHEALTNSVVHGNLEVSSALKENGDSAFAEALAAHAADPRLNARVVDILVIYDGQRIAWTFVDQGKGFDVATALARAASDDPELQLSSGRGITLMQAFVDEVTYDQGGRRVTLALRQADEKRRQPRQPLLSTVRVAPVRGDGSVDWEGQHDAVTRDLSPGGIGLLQARLTAGMRLLIGMEGGGEVVYLPAEVRHCETTPDGLVRLGCRFDGLSESSASDNSAAAAAAVGSLLDRLDGVLLPHDERRTHRRATYTERIRISGGPGPDVGFARNLSRGGISFLVGQPVPLERRVLTLPVHDGAPLELFADIVRCVSLADGVFEVGARFAGIAN